MATRKSSASKSKGASGRSRSVRRATSKTRSSKLSRAAKSRKRTVSGKFASTGKSTKRKAGFPSTPHTRTSSGRKLFEPINMTPTERLNAGEKLPHYISKTRQPWSEADLKELRTLAKKNTPTRVISSKIGRSPASVRSKAKDEHISLRPPNRSPYGTVRS